MRLCVEPERVSWQLTDGTVMGLIWRIVKEGTNSGSVIKVKGTNRISETLETRSSGERLQLGFWGLELRRKNDLRAAGHQHPSSLCWWGAHRSRLSPLFPACPLPVRFLFVCFILSESKSLLPMVTCRLSRRRNRGKQQQNYNFLFLL